MFLRASGMLSIALSGLTVLLSVSGVSAACYCACVTMEALDALRAFRTMHVVIPERPSAMGP